MLQMIINIHGGVAGQPSLSWATTTTARIKNQLIMKGWKEWKLESRKIMCQKYIHHQNLMKKHAHRGHSEIPPRRRQPREQSMSLPMPTSDHGAQHA